MYDERKQLTECQKIDQLVHRNHSLHGNVKRHLSYILKYRQERIFSFNLIH